MGSVVVGVGVLRPTLLDVPGDPSPEDPSDTANALPPSGQHPAPSPFPPVPVGGSGLLVAAGGEAAGGRLVVLADGNT